MNILSIASARPNFVKLAAVHHALADIPDIKHTIIHTGQHFDPMFSDVFFEQLAIPQPAVNLGVHATTRDEAVMKTKEAMIPVLREQRPDWVLVYGDVNGALGGAQAATICGTRFAHVEAGLRSFDPQMPEEHNRIGIDRIAHVLLCSEQSGVDNLQREKAAGQIELVGNTMIDTLIRMMPAIETEPLPQDLPSAFAVATLHRPSNVDTEQALRTNMEFLEEIELPLLLPAHHRLRASLKRFHMTVPSNVLLMEPMGYLSFLHLVQDALFVLTDSGGIQEETVLLKKRCFTLRKNTERPVTIESGSNVLIDLDKPQDRASVLAYATNPLSPNVTIPSLWDGKAGERIAKVLLHAS